jgi:polysaccharide biosynthesis protein PslJ
VIGDPILLPVLAVAATLLVQRLGGGAGSGVDLSDVVLAVAALICLPLVDWNRARSLTVAVGYAGMYQAVLLLAVVDHPNSHDALEWGHRLFLVAGSLIVGWVVTTRQRAPQAILVLLLGCCLLAVLTLEHAVTLDFAPAQWGLYQKNYIGTMMWMAIVIAHLSPSWAAIPPRLARLTKYLCAAALLASQSKQAIIALAVAIVVAVLRQPSVRRRSKVILVALGPLVVFAYIVASDEVTTYLNHGSNSLQARTVAYTSGLDVWRLDRWFGQGPRWWYLPHFAGEVQPPNILLEAITESGIIGAVALLVLLVGVMALLARLPRELATVGLVLVLGRAVEGVFDLYWISADGALPWLIAGLCLGAADSALSRRSPAAASRGGARLLSPLSV